MSKKVVVTGLGLVTPLANGVTQSWNLLLQGKSGVKSITQFEVSDLSSRIAGIVPREGEGAFDLCRYMPNKKDHGKIDSFIGYCIAAASEAVEDSGLLEYGPLQKDRVGVVIGSGIGGLPRIEDTARILHLKGARRISPFFIPASLINLTSGHVSMRYNFTGPNESTVSACSTGAHAITQAARLIKLGEADVVVAGGTEGTICRLGVGGFCAMRALSSGFNDTPELASRPWDKKRDGFVIAEGSGVLILEDYEHAKKRGAKIYAEVAASGESGDAYHIAAPEPDGKGALKAMGLALSRGNVSPADVDYINAHGTSTPAGDIAEVLAIKEVFGADIGNVSVSSTKSSIGHLLGAAGSVEAIFSILSMRDSVLPPTLNLDDPADECEGVNLVGKQSEEKNVDVALSNSFGFGGTNVAVLFKKVK